MLERGSSLGGGTRRLLTGAAPRMQAILPRRGEGGQDSHPPPIILIAYPAARFYCFSTRKKIGPSVPDRPALVRSNVLVVMSPASASTPSSRSFSHVVMSREYLTV